MAKLSTLMRTVDMCIPFGDGELNITVRPDSFTGQRLTQMQEALKAEETDSAEFLFMCGFLADLLVKWDLENDDGTPFEISKVSIFSGLPVTIVAKLLEEIQKGITVNPQKPES